MNNLKFIIMPLLFLCVSCSEDTIIAKAPMYALPQTAANEMVEESMYLNLEVVNNAINVTLEIDSVDLESSYNVLQVMCDEVTVMYQDSVQIGYIELASHSNKRGQCTVLLYGRVYCPTYPIYEGLIYIPISGSLQPGQNYLKLDLHDGCPWYYKYNDNYCKLLQSIKFDVSVNDWEDSETIINM